MIVEILIFILTSLIAYFIYMHKSIQKLYDSRDVKYVPGIPVFGNVYKSTFLKQHVSYDIEDVYNAFPNEKYVGFIESTVPILLIKDPELIKRVTVKDFEHFSDHRQFFGDPIFKDSLIMLKGDKWRDMRTTLSPAFTGSKMRQMVPFMVETSEDIIDHLKETEGTIMNVDDLVRCYTNDVIASTAFGLRVNTLKDRDNQFYKMGQSLLNFDALARIKAFLSAIVPSAASYLTIFPQETTDFFIKMVTETMEYREKNNIERPDMIQLLMEADKGLLKSTENEDKDKIGFTTNDEFNVMKPKSNARRWTKNELAAQAFIFFFAGYESSASTLVMAIHELVLNPQVQEKLYEEVAGFFKKGEKLTFDTIAQLKYMDMVLNETMRKWSAALILDREVQKPYTLPPAHEGGKTYELKPGDIIYNCVNATHMNEEFYPNPTKFDPERFSDENKSKIVPFTFLPFGIGPRNCIGLRFALLELKVLLFHIVSNFHIQRCEKTVEPITLQPTSFNIKVQGGSFVTFISRK